MYGIRRRCACSFCLSSLHCILQHHLEVVKSDVSRDEICFVHVLKQKCKPGLGCTSRVKLAISAILKQYAAYGDGVQNHNSPGEFHVDTSPPTTISPSPMQGVA